MYMYTVEELVDELVGKLEELQDGTEASTSDLIFVVCGTNGDEGSAGDLTLDDLFYVDEQLRKRAIQSGIYLDTSRFEGLNASLPFDQRYVVRRM